MTELWIHVPADVDALNDHEWIELEDLLGKLHISLLEAGGSDIECNINIEADGLMAGPTLAQIVHSEPYVRWLATLGRRTE